MRILMAIHHILDPGYGAAGVTLSVGGAMQTLGCEVEYFDFVKAFGQSTIPKGPWASVRYPWRVARLLRQRAGEFDVLDITSGDNWVWASRGRPNARLAHALITRSHGIEHVANREVRAAAARSGEKLSWKFPIYWGGFREWEVRQSLLRADMSILGSELDRQFAINELRIPQEKLAVVPNGIAPEFERTAEPAEPGAGPLRLAFIGSWIERKGTAAVIEGLRLVQAKAIDFRLTVYGSRVAADSVLQSFDASVRPYVRVVESYQRAQLPSLLANEEIVLSASLSEGFSLALGEAMACGLAPIATPVGGAPLMIDDGRNGVMIPINDALALASAVVNLASRREALLAMRRAARLTALGYKWDQIGRKTIDLYETVLKSRAARQGEHVTV